MAAHPVDPELEKYADYAESLQRFEFHEPDFQIHERGSLARLGMALTELSRTIERRFQEQSQLLDIMENINQGTLLDEVLDHVFDGFRPVIPYDRIGFAVLENEGQVVRAYWARSELDEILIRKGYAQPIKDSSLKQIIETGQPRIINDLVAYQASRPHSHSTRLALAEGIRSSLTCPLIAGGKAIGFIFSPASKPIPTPMYTRTFFCASPACCPGLSTRPGSTRNCFSATAN